jgi:elongation factor 3
VTKYLEELTDVTCIIVSHNTKLLDTVCTNVLRIDALKLSNFKGSLTE